MNTLKTKPLTPETFAPYGKVAKLPSTPPLAVANNFKYWSDTANYGIDGETEIGFCTVYRLPEMRIDWVERHLRTPEILIPIDGPFLLPVLSDGVDDQPELFRVNPGEAVIIHPGVWHSACIPVDSAEITYFVIFRKGTPYEDVIKKDIAPATFV